jgi:hypothetical protein
VISEDDGRAFRAMMGSDFAGSWAGLVGKTRIDAPSGMKEGQDADGTIEHAPDTGRFTVKVWAGAERAADCGVA